MVAIKNLKRFFVTESGLQVHFVFFSNPYRRAPALSRGQIA
jgi:hypothetical protein